MVGRMIQVRFNKINALAQIPQYMSEGAAGCDAYACLEEPITLNPGDRVAVSTGLAIEIPPGYEVQVRPRSGLAIKKGVTVVNAPGTIDSDYRGEVKVLLVNLDKNPVTIEHGERVAQFVVAKVEQIQWVPISEEEALSETARGVGGFGSTGSHAAPTA